MQFSFDSFEVMPYPLDSGPVSKTPPEPPEPHAVSQKRRPLRLRGLVPRIFRSFEAMSFGWTTAWEAVPKRKDRARTGRSSLSFEGK